jgi:outer membrane protein assembly factor BamB
MTTFELVPDDEQDDGHGLVAPDGDDGRGATARLAGLRGRVSRRWRALSRRGRAAVAAGVAVVVLVATTAAVAPGLLDARDQRLRAEAVAGRPGVVGDLSEPLAIAWEVRQGGSVATVLEGRLLAVMQGAGVRALDPASGEVVWEHDLGGGAWCGPEPWLPGDWGVRAETVVCVGDDGSTVTTLDARGDVLGVRDIARPDEERIADLGGAPGVVAAAGGAVAVLDRGAAVTVPWEEGDDPARTLEDLRDAGWTAPIVRVEDAVTGAVRAEVNLRLSAEHLRDCGTSEEGGKTALHLEPWIEATPSSTTISLCGARQTVTPSGDVIDLHDGLRNLAPLPGGGFVVQGETSEILDARGERQATINGWVVTPLVDTEPDGPVLAMLGATGGSTSFSAVGRDGETVWSHRISALTMPLARVGDTVVVADEDSVTALDAVTGDERWRLPGLLDADPGGGEYVSGVVTDGTRLLLAVSSPTVQDTETGETRSGHRLVALDLRDGTTAWERPREGDLWAFSAVDGHLVVQGNGLWGLERS